MKREIKFRAWDKKMKRVVSVYGIDLNNSQIRTATEGALNIDDFELMQFTGLKDKNGKEIYEGDILKAEGALDIFYNTVIEFGEGSFRFKNRVGNWEYMKDFLSDWFEVIGNIWENPDLLNT